MLELNRKNDFVQAVFEYISDGNITSAITIFRKLEEKHKILFIPMTDSNKEEFYDDIWIENNLYPFLSDSQLIVAGDVLDFIEILDTDFRELGVT